MSYNSRSRYTAYESLERKAANAIGRKTASRTVKKTPQELKEMRDFIFGLTPSTDTPTTPTIDVYAVTKQNKEKYDMLSGRFCSMVMRDGTFYHGRFSKSNELYEVDHNSSIIFYSSTHKKHVTIELNQIVTIKANSVEVHF